MSRTTRRPRIEVWMYVKDFSRMRRRRKEKGFSQVQLAALVGCTQQYISLIESGDDRDVSERVADKVCRWLDLETEDVFEERRIVRTPRITSDTSVDGIPA